MNQYEFNDNERSYQTRARSAQPHRNMYERERTERSRYHRDENRRIEDERYNYYSYPEISLSDDDDLDDLSESESDWETYARRPKYPRIRRNFSTPNLLIDIDDVEPRRGRTRSRGPVFNNFIIDDHYYETVRDEYEYQPPYNHRQESYDELPSMRAPRSRGRSYERPSYEGGQLRIENEEQVNSRIYESGTYVQRWREPVKFAPHDEVLKPIEWQAKLEILEAQVLDHSSYRDFPWHMRMLELDRFFIHIAEAHQVIYKVASNLQRMKQANYCSETFNILVLEKQRPSVARLVGISLTSVSIFSDKLAELLLRDGNLPFHQARAFLRSCYDFLLALELDIPAFQDSYGYYSSGNVQYSYVRSREGILSAIMYATRAIGFLLDIATVSFCGAHLEPFDEVYFDRVSPISFYQLPCDAQSATIDLQLRSFQCLEGFLQGRPVWVFSSTDMDYTELSPDIPLYLSTPPDEFANVWGPMWKSVSPRDPGNTLRYIVSPGFIIPWRWTPGQPALLTNEIHCHWSKDDYDIDSIFSQTVHGRTERLLIGANPTLLMNRFCQPDKRAFYSKMSRNGVLKELGLHHGGWAAGPINISAGVSSSALLPLALKLDVSMPLTKKPPKSLRDRICVDMVAEPSEHFSYLNKYFGVEISACTGNARRVTLANVLSSQTMREYLHLRVRWSSAERDSYFHALQKPNSASAVYDLYYYGSEDQMKSYDVALKLSIAGLADTRVKSSHLRALWAWDGNAYIVRFRLSDHKWAGLLTDTLTTCSLAIVNQTCLECSTRETRHLPTVPIGVPTVFETSLVINPDAHLPKGLETIRAGFRLSEGHISRRLREGDTFDIKDHGRVRVLRTPVDPAGRSFGIFVEFVKTFIPARRQTVKHFFQNVARRDLLDTFHREYKDDKQDMDQSWFYVFVVSNSRKMGAWLPR